MATASVMLSCSGSLGSALQKPPRLSWAQGRFALHVSVFVAHVADVTVDVSPDSNTISMTFTTCDGDRTVTSPPTTLRLAPFAAVSASSKPPVIRIDRFDIIFPKVKKGAWERLTLVPVKELRHYVSYDWELGAELEAMDEELDIHSSEPTSSDDDAEGQQIVGLEATTRELACDDDNHATTKAPVAPSLPPTDPMPAPCTAPSGPADLGTNCSKTTDSKRSVAAAPPTNMEVAVRDDASPVALSKQSSSQSHRRTATHASSDVQAFASMLIKLMAALAVAALIMNALLSMNKDTDRGVAEWWERVLPWAMGIWSGDTVPLAAGLSTS